MAAERADNYRVLQDIKKSDPRGGAMLEFVINKIVELARESGNPLTEPITILDGDNMTQEEEELALFESYIKRGYTPEVAEKKAKEVLRDMKLLFRE